MTLQDLPHTGEYIIIAAPDASLRPVMVWAERNIPISDIESFRPTYTPECVLIEGGYYTFLPVTHFHSDHTAYLYNFDGTLTKIR